jgi:hypothetical protein
MAPRTSRDLPGTKPQKDEERDTQKAIIKDADKTEGKDRDQSKEMVEPSISL